MTNDDHPEGAGSAEAPSAGAESHMLQNVGELLRTPTEGQDMRKSFFLPLELYDDGKDSNLVVGGLPPGDKEEPSGDA